MVELKNQEWSQAPRTVLGIYTQLRTPTKSRTSLLFSFKNPRGLGSNGGALSRSVPRVPVRTHLGLQFGLGLDSDRTWTGLWTQAPEVTPLQIWYTSLYPHYLLISAFLTHIHSDSDLFLTPNSGFPFMYSQSPFKYCI